MSLTIVKFENLQRNMFNYGLAGENTLVLEKKRLLGVVKALQSDYFETQKIDTRIYDIKQSVLLSRLSEIEKDISIKDLEKSLRLNGRFSGVWKKIYREK